jgi:hypothetical protein
MKEIRKIGSILEISDFFFYSPFAIISSLILDIRCL